MKAKNLDVPGTSQQPENASVKDVDDNRRRPGHFTISVMILMERSSQNSEKDGASGLIATALI